MLEIVGLAAHYGRAAVLEGLSFGLGDGETLALLGRNGAGKSTTLKAVMGLVRPSGGRVRFDGQEIAGWAPYRIARAGLGYVPEERRIFADLTVRENLLVGRRRGSAWSEERVFSLFPALAPMADRLGNAMSGGEQQMLTIARTLMGGPRTILLDEPSEGLAPVVVAQMREAVLALRAEGVSVLLAEQNVRFASAVADRIVILEHGRLAWWGSSAELEADEGARREFLAV